MNEIKENNMEFQLNEEAFNIIPVVEKLNQNFFSLDFLLTKSQNMKTKHLAPSSLYLFL